MEAEHASKPPVAQGRNQQGRKNALTNENENMMFRNVPDAAKAVLRGQFIAETGLPQGTRKISN